MNIHIELQSNLKNYPASRYERVVLFEFPFKSVPFLFRFMFVGKIILPNVPGDSLIPMLPLRKMHTICIRHSLVCHIA